MSKEEKTAFLLIHGFTGTHYEMEPLAKYLRNKGIHAENIVLPGHETSVEDLKDRKWHELTDYAQEQLDILKQNFKSVYICGLSLGGAITLYLGANNPDIGGIIPLAAPAFSPDWRMVLLTYLPFVHLVYPYHGNEEKGWEDNDSLKTHQSYGTYPIKTTSQLFKLFKINKKKMRDIEVPILIAHAKNDPTISFEHAEKIYSSVSSMNKEIIQIQRGGHVIPKDAGRKQLFEEIDKWLAKRQK
ncbi:MAG: alpha/beta hydrolase [Candidatus Heimdallarchaeaceae archaeon]